MVEGDLTGWTKNVRGTVGGFIPRFRKASPRLSAELPYAGFFSLAEWLRHRAGRQRFYFVHGQFGHLRDLLEGQAVHL